jgi:ABC-2 type transport system ATP-binding protein
MALPVLVQDLRKRYGAVEAVRGVSFTVTPGEIFGLLGPNGAGKTTTVECMVGLREADAGTIEIGGVDVRRQPAEARQRLGVALQSTALPDQITPREALRMFGAFYRDPLSPDALLQRFGLEEKADAAYATLSGGQRQKLALALAFLNRPFVVLLDEPTTGLDVHARHELHAEIRRLRDDGCAVVLTTHQLPEAEALCDRVAIIDRGTIVAVGAPGSLLAGAEAARAVTLRANRAVPTDLLAGLAEINSLQIAGERLAFRVRDVTRVVPEVMRRMAAAGLEVRELEVRESSLEEAFLRLTRDTEARS